MSPSDSITKVLGCEDQAYPGTPASSGLQIGGLTFDRLDKPMAQNSAVRLAAGNTAWYLYKAFVYVNGAPNSRIRFAIESPKAALLYYVDQATWSSDHSPTGILSHATTEVSVEACPGLTAYTGGVLVQSPTCVRVRVTTDGTPAGKADLRLGVNACS